MDLNGFSKKLANHTHMVALHFTHYNFARVHQTLRVTPMEAKMVLPNGKEKPVADHVWTIDGDRESAAGECGAKVRELPSPQRWTTQSRDDE